MTTSKHLAYGKCISEAGNTVLQTCKIIHLMKSNESDENRLQNAKEISESLVIKEGNGKTQLNAIECRVHS